jgi:hypothetical protein
MGAGGFASVVNRQGRETDHVNPSNAEGKNAWSYNSIPPTCLHALYRDNIKVFNQQLLRINRSAVVVRHHALCVLPDLCGMCVPCTQDSHTILCYTTDAIATELTSLIRRPDIRYLYASSTLFTERGGRAV